MKALFFVLMVACHADPVYGVVALCGDDAGVDAPADAPIDAQVWDPSPATSFPDVTGQGHPTVTMLFPTAYPSTAHQARPLLLFLNGWNQTGDTVLSRFRMTGYENEGIGALILAPSGIIGSENKRRWNASAACCEPIQPANDDVVYLGGLVDRVIAAGWHVDLARVFVLGMSNGAAMAHRLLCERSDVFTGGILISGIGVPSGMSCSPANPTHRVHAHSRTDDTFFYAGGTATFTTPDMPVAYPAFESGEVAQAISANGCSGTYATTPSPNPTNRTLNLNDHPSYPTMQADTVVTEISGCPSNGSITIWQGPYFAPTWNHSLITSPEFGGYIRDWLATHAR